MKHEPQCCFNFMHLTGGVCFGSFFLLRHADSPIFTAADYLQSSSQTPTETCSHAFYIQRAFWDQFCLHDLQPASVQSISQQHAHNCLILIRSTCCPLQSLLDKFSFMFLHQTPNCDTQLTFNAYSFSICTLFTSEDPEKWCSMDGSMDWWMDGWMDRHTYVCLLQREKVRGQVRVKVLREEPVWGTLGTFDQKIALKFTVRYIRSFQWKRFLTPETENRRKDGTKGHDKHQVRMSEDKCDSLTEWLQLICIAKENPLWNSHILCEYFKMSEAEQAGLSLKSHTLFRTDALLKWL